MTAKSRSITMICMTTVDRLSVTMPEDVGAAVRDAAFQAGVSVSSWLTSAARRQLRSELLRRALDAWEAEDGPLTEAERKLAADELGLPYRPRS